MKIHRFAAVISALVLALGLSGCYTVISTTRTVASNATEENQWNAEETGQDSLDVQPGSVVNHYYIYDDWPGHWDFDPFWDSPYHWCYTSWWWHGYYDPWYSPWTYYGYGWNPYTRYGYYGWGSWYSHGFDDPYWVYADGYYGQGKRRPFDRRESVHGRGGSGDPGFAAMASVGASRASKGADASGPGLIDRRTRRGTGIVSGSGIARSGSAASSGGIRRGESVGSTGRSSGGASKSSGSSGGSTRRERRGSSSSSPSSSSGSSGSSYSPPSRSSSPPSSSGSSSSSSSSGSGGQSGRRSRR